LPKRYSPSIVVICFLSLPKERDTQLYGNGDGMRIRYAFRNLLITRGRFFIALFGISLAAFLMAMQGSLLYGFTRASSALVDAFDADIWITPRGLVALEYATLFEDRLTWLAPGVPGVSAAGRGLVGQTQVQKQNGDRYAVFVVGVERDFRGRTPNARASLAPPATFVNVAAVNDTDLPALGISKLPATIEVGGMRVDIAAVTSGFANFLGSPVLFADLNFARRVLAADKPMTNFILVRVAPGYSVTEVRDRLRERFSKFDVLTKSEFSFRCRYYWLAQTGVGGALLLATLLGFFIGVSVVAQTIYSQTSERVDEYATLKAMGASNWYVISIVLCQSLFCGAVGVVVGLAFAEVFVAAAKSTIGWILFPLWLKFVVVAAVALLCVIAAFIGSRPATAVEPARVFRA
jgi:putative ABC transport system permease protein